MAKDSSWESLLRRRLIQGAVKGAGRSLRVHFLGEVVSSDAGLGVTTLEIEIEDELSKLFKMVEGGVESAVRVTGVEPIFSEEMGREGDGDTITESTCEEMFLGFCDFLKRGPFMAKLKKGREGRERETECK